MGVFATSSHLKKRYNYNRGYTVRSILISLLASSAGLITGYDLGIGAGVTSMTDFESVFFPAIYEKSQHFKASSPWCKFDSQKLQIYTSCFYLAGFVGSLWSGHVARKHGRKFCILLSGILYMIGAGFTSGAAHTERGLSMLILGRLALGFGCGFGNTVVLIYAAEMSPPQWRGRTTFFFQWSSTFGQLVAQLINYGMVNLKHNGWRVSYALAAVPAIPVLLAGILLPETPSSLIERGKYEKGRKVLQFIRGQEDVELEFQDVLMHTQEAQKLRSSTHWTALFRKCYTPFLIASIVLPLVHQLSGNNAIVFYAPVLFRTMGSGRKSSLLRTVILGCSKLGAGTIGLLTVDIVGRKPLLIGGGIIMAACQAVVAVLMGHYLPTHKTKSVIPSNVSNGLLAAICIFVGMFSLSWGPLGFSVTAEMQPAEIRASANGLAHGLSMLFSFIASETLLTMICRIRWGTFLFYGLIVTFGVLYTIFFLPETKSMYIEEVYESFQRHWFWKRFPAPPRPSLAGFQQHNSTLDETAGKESKLHTGSSESEDSKQSDNSPMKAFK